MAIFDDDAPELAVPAGIGDIPGIIVDDEQAGVGLTLPAETEIESADIIAIVELK